MPYRIAFAVIAAILVAAVVYANVSTCPIIFEKITAKEHDCCKRSKGSEEAPAKKACPNPEGSTPDKKESPKITGIEADFGSTIGEPVMPAVRKVVIDSVRPAYSPPDLFALNSAFLI
jgi:hypothetical protein